ncbi:MAG: RT0821/Lpp0805 family surface protein [Pseudomonadota bacterium]|nr:RT0821/Lpp0805 family surface protein [Pseudomonadota bacterium]
MNRIVALLYVFLLGACSDSYRMTTGQMLGAVSGGVIGSYAGTQVGGGSGKLLFIVRGAALGSLIGYAYGDSLMPSDHAKFTNSAKVAMDNSYDGQVFSWVNPESGLAGTITPIRSYYADGQYCRDFDATIAMTNGLGKSKGRACKTDDDDWFLNSRI